jgi:hypothetical protein
MLEEPQRLQRKLLMAQSLGIPSNPFRQATKSATGWSSLQEQALFNLEDLTLSTFPKGEPSRGSRLVSWCLERASASLLLFHFL